MAPRKINPIKNIKIPENYNNDISSLIDKEDISATRWWENFNDDALNKTVDKVIENNLDLKLAVLRVESMESQFKIVRGSRLPAISTTGNYSKSEGPVTEMEFSQSGMETSQSIQETEMYSLRTGLRFELDIWGKLRSNHKSAVETFKASKADLRTVYIGIISQAIILHYDIEAQLREVEISKKNLASAKYNYEISQKKYKMGIVPKTSLEMSKQAHNNFISKLERDKQLLDMKNNQLSILMGEYPENFEKTGSIENNFLPEMIKIPVHIPSTLLKTRSDIVSSAHNLEAARQQVGAAFAAFFPSISITAAANFASLSFDDLFNELSLTKTIAGEATEVIFAGGSKVASYKLKKVQYEQAVLNYKKTVLNAFQDVEDALKNLEFAKINQKAAEGNMISAKSVFKISDQKYKFGVINYSQLLDSERNMLSMLSASNSADKALIAARVQLHSALGGEWIK
ncbi:MAG: TolC family protein [Candidatus Cloacimonetes bacterium]|nr:TolC family protein [Candidatus Cloacimonadota bacterium]